MRKRGKASVIFATSNPHKVQEVQSVLQEYPITIKPLNIKGPEIQSGNLVDIAKYSVLWAVQQIKVPVFVEDTGLFIEALNGFPGTMASYVYTTIGTAGILKLLMSETNRTAQFKSVIAYCSPRNEPKCFAGEVHGRVSLREKGTKGFGFDALFIPRDGGGKTFGEMNVAEKNNHSHRARATKKFVQWLITNWNH
jgi:XTP/dITP diphosphohydrolase